MSEINMQEVEMVAFQIISSVGTARSCFIEAIHEARNGNYEAAEQLISDGDEAFAEGHDAHLSILSKEAETGKSNVCLIILHAEDQLMSAEGFKILAQEFIDTYKRMDELEAKVK